MKRTSVPRLRVAVLGLVLLAGCASTPETKPEGVKLKEAAHSQQQWTGVAISREGRMFVNCPRWFDGVEISVAEISKKGKVAAPYPDVDWNRWVVPFDPDRHLICVQSVVIDQHDFLWILDAANPQFEGVVEGGAKLLKVDLRTNEVALSVRFDETVALPDSYLNDVRVDARRGYAYITDSKLGALIVVDLATGESRRVLDNHPSTKSEDLVLVIGGREWRRPDGSVPCVHSDGLALHPSGDWLYYQALTGDTLYRIATEFLRDASLSPEALGTKVERVGRTFAVDGMIFGPGGNLYLTALEHNAVKRYTLDGRIETVVEDPRILWPGSLAFGPDGALYFSAAQIHLGRNHQGPYKIFKVRPKDMAR